MREILFRGMSQSLKNEDSEWVYGSLDISTNNRMGYPRIIVHDPELHYGSKYVSMQTVGQFTGLLDKNGKKIFEGDICTNEVFWDEPRQIGFNYLNTVCSISDGSEYMFSVSTLDEIEVIGTIHDK